MVEVEVEETAPRGEIPGTDMNMNDMLGSILPKRTKIRKVEVREARRILVAEEEQNLIDMDSVYSEAIERAEQHGIVFLDEIDKVAGRGAGNGGPDVSREGVQRDILPIVEGSTVNTKYGPVRTDHMLFIAAGAFHVSKVTDLIPELQGRFPVRVDLKPLTREDYKRILTQPENALIRQYQMLFEGGQCLAHLRRQRPGTPSPTTPGRPTRLPKTSARGGCSTLLEKNTQRHRLQRRRRRRARGGGQGRCRVCAGSAFRRYAVQGRKKVHPLRHTGAHSLPRFCALCANLFEIACFAPISGRMLHRYTMYSSSMGVFA